jgi:hypothetical protein
LALAVIYSIYVLIRIIRKQKIIRET